MSDETLGPFRRDGRMRFATEARYDEAAQRAIRTGVTLEFPAYLVVLSLGPLVIATATATWWMPLISALLLFFAWKSHRSYAVARENITDVGPRRTWITADGVFLDGVLGPARWDWDAVDHVRRSGDYVVVQFGSREVLAMPVEGAEAERLVSFIRERTKRKLTDNPGRMLLWLAILYVTTMVASLAIGMLL